MGCGGSRERLPAGDVDGVREAASGLGHHPGVAGASDIPQRHGRPASDRRTTSGSEGGGAARKYEYRVPDVVSLRSVAVVNLPMVVMSEAGVLTYANDSAIEWLGYSSVEELVGQPVGILMDAELAKVHQHFVERYLRTGVSAGVVGGRGRRVKVVKKDRSTASAILTVARLDSGDFLAALVDASESERAALAEAGLLKALRAVRQRTGFLSFLSHEIRVPLNALSLGLEQLSAELKDAGAAGATHGDDVGLLLSDMQSCCRSILYLLNDVLDLDKLQTGMCVFRHQATIVPRLVDGALSVARAARSKGIEIVSHIDRRLDESVLLWIDKHRILQCLNNYLSNARRHTPHGGKIEVRARLIGEQQRSDADVEPPARSPRGAIGPDVGLRKAAAIVPPPAEYDLTMCVRFEVWNSGSFIPEEARSRVFMSYVQVDSPAQPTGAGAPTGARSGLGLAIVKNIVEQGHYGHVFVDSDRSAGTTFGFEIKVPARVVATEALRLRSPPSTQLSRASSTSDGCGAAAATPSECVLDGAAGDCTAPADGVGASPVRRDGEPTVLYVDDSDIK